MTVKRVVAPRRWIGVSGDTMPTVALNNPVPEGSTFYARDTGVLYITYDGTNWVPKFDPVSGTLIEVRVATAVPGTGHAANDVINATTCTTTAVAIQFANVVRNNGGYGRIIGASIIDETENVSPRIQVQLYTAEPTCVNEDEATNTGVIKADRSIWIGNLDFPALNAVSASIASYAQISPSTVGNLPLTFKCGAASTTLYAIYVAVDAFTHATTDDIEVTLEVEQI